MQDKESLLRERRKDEHIALAYAQFDPDKKSAFADVRLLGTSLPHISVDDVDLTTEFSGMQFPFPFYINAMTGGSRHAKGINENLSIIARELEVPLALGSQSAALKNETLIDTYKIARDVNPHGKIFANLSPAVPVDKGLQAIEMIKADALQIHINPLQELIMNEGDRDFTNWLRTIEMYVAKADVPVIVKEVGFGLTRETAEQLIQVGVKTIDLAGTGGTNFAQIENDRNRDHRYDYLTNWGLSTSESLLDTSALAVERLASGGIKTPLDIVKALALGAKSVGMAGFVLHILKKNGVDGAITILKDWQLQLKHLFVLNNAKHVNELRKTAILLQGSLSDFCLSRHIDIQQFNINKNQDESY